MQNVVAQAASMNLEQWGWSLLDAGSFGFASVTLNTLLPVIFNQHQKGVTQPHNIIAAWGYVMSASNLVGFLLSPCLGTYVDVTSRRKLVLVSFAIVAILGGVAAIASSYESHVAMMVFTAIAMVGYNATCFIYNSMMMFIFPTEKIHTASCVSCSFSNLGATFTLIILLIVILGHHADESDIPKSAALTIVVIGTVWYAAFLTFFAFTVNEPNHPEACVEDAPVFGGEIPGEDAPGFLSRLSSSMEETLSGEVI